MTFPFELHRMHGKEAPARLAALEALGPAVPVILGSAKDLKRVAETLEMNDERTVEELITAARGIDPAAWFAARRASSPYDDVKEAGWPQGAHRANNSLTAHVHVLTREPLPEVNIAVIPAAEAWMLPCYLRIGGWNECPGAEEHAALFKYWGGKYGAKVACITGDVIEMKVAHPPTTREQALVLANEQYLYCADIVLQGTESIEALAATLLEAKVWYFWWD